MTTSTYSYAPFLSSIWRTEHCDPNNWAYTPSTYDVEGVELVGDPHMVLWKDLKSINMTNPGRKGGIDFVATAKLKNDIVENGINTDEGSMIYYDVDSNEKINGFHRELVCSELDIPGFMAQGVRFDSPLAKVRFCTRSNNRILLQHNNTSAADVETAVRNVLELSPPPTRKSISKEVNFLGHHLSDGTRDNIRDTLFAEYLCSGVKLGIRYIPHNQNTINILIEKNFKYVKGRSKNPPKQTSAWYNEIWNNPDEHCLIVYMSNVEGRIGSLLTSNLKAVEDNKPLHLLFAVTLPSEKQTLQFKREKVFTTDLHTVEERILRAFGKDKGIGEYHRSMISWNHPDCQHRFVAQDSHNENFDDLIYVKNRQFN